LRVKNRADLRILEISHRCDRLYIVLDTFLSEVSQDYISKNSSMGHPFDNTVLFIQRDNRICSNIFGQSYADNQIYKADGDWTLDSSSVIY